MVRGGPKLYPAPARRRSSVRPSRTENRGSHWMSTRLSEQAGLGGLDPTSSRIRRSSSPCLRASSIGVKEGGTATVRGAEMTRYIGQARPAQVARRRARPLELTDEQERSGLAEHAEQLADQVGTKASRSRSSSTPMAASAGLTMDLSMKAWGSGSRCSRPSTTTTSASRSTSTRRPPAGHRRDEAAAALFAAARLAAPPAVASPRRSKSPARTRSIRPVRTPEASRTSGDGSCLYRRTIAASRRSSSPVPAERGDADETVTRSNELSPAGSLQHVQPVLRLQQRVGAEPATSSTRGSSSRRSCGSHPPAVRPADVHRRELLRELGTGGRVVRRGRLAR